MIDLKVYDISGKEEISQYKTHLDQINAHHPYFRYELINIASEPGQELKYFLLKSNTTPIILMPFFLKQIHIAGKPTTYFDVSSPWGYMGPLLGKENTDLLTDFWKAVDAWYIANNVITEFIRFNFSDNQLFYTGTTIHTLSNIRGKLLDEETLWKGFKRSVRKNYRTALKNGLQCRIYHRSIPLEKVEEFYSIWFGTMERHDADKSYYHSRDYFKNFIASNPDHCALAIVYNDSNQPISTELLLLSEETMYSFLGGTNADSFQLRPNDLLKIEAINWARNEGIKYYVLGGGLSDGDSLYQYKKKFFPDDPEISFFTGRKILDKAVYADLNHKVGKSGTVDNIAEGFFPQYRFPGSTS